MTARKPAFIRHSPGREAQIQRRLLDVAERRFRRKIAKVIREESDQLVAKYRELGYVPVPTDDDFRAFRDVYFDIGHVTARAFGSRIVAQGKASGGPVASCHWCSAPASACCSL